MTPRNRAGEIALAVYREVLKAVRADALIHNSVRRNGDVLHIQDLVYDLDRFRRVFVGGSGKASALMAATLAEIVGDRLEGGLVVTKAGHAVPASGLEMLEAAHPVPDESSLAAGERMLRFAAEAREGDLVLYALSGGSSALMEAPADGVSLERLQALNRALLADGVDIHAMNALRRRLSRIKGGGLSRAFGLATVAVVVISDVMDDDLSVIGSGPFYAPDETARPEIPAPLGGDLRSLLDRPVPEPGPRREHRIVGDNHTAVQAALRAGAGLGLEVYAGLRDWSFGVPWVARLDGEARHVGAYLGEALAEGAAYLANPSLFVSGGETTVTIQSPGGLGGRCQEIACAAAVAMRGVAGVALLAGSTDGTDGPTDVAAGLVDGESEARARAGGISGDQALAASDSFAYLQACEGLVRTGPTQSNVNDVVLAVHG